jgi:DNA-binding XRE family transcriptional regulator
MKTPPKRLPSEATWMKLRDRARLRRERRRNNYTQTDLANLVGIAQQYISAMETGTDLDCSERVAEKICRYLDIELEDLFEPGKRFRTPEVTSNSRVPGRAA